MLSMPNCLKCVFWKQALWVYRQSSRQPEGDPSHSTSPCCPGKVVQGCVASGDPFGNRRCGRDQEMLVEWMSQKLVIHCPSGGHRMMFYSVWLGESSHEATEPCKEYFLLVLTFSKTCLGKWHAVPWVYSVSPPEKGGALCSGGELGMDVRSSIKSLGSTPRKAPGSGKTCMLHDYKMLWGKQVHVACS